MKGATPLIGILVILVILLVGALFFSGTLGVIPDCKTIYCNDFNFICCSEYPNPEISYLSNGEAKECPTYATRCKVTPPSSTFNTYSVYEECEQIQGWFGPYWSCSGFIKSGSTPDRFEKGQWILASTNNIKVEVWREHLYDCGKAGCTIGKSVQGASGCSFVTDKSVYTESGQLTRQPTGSQISYTVPYGECYLYTSYALRRECGNTCERCDSHLDCAGQYPYKYTYEGQTYGATCQLGTLQLYGCKKGESQCSEKDVLPDGTEICSGYQLTQSMCDQIIGVPVQCCPDTDDCGVNAVCDRNTFTCSQTAGCSFDWQCGTMISCDRASKTIKQPKCINGQCSQEVLREVDCCFDTDCTHGYYCSEDYKCLEDPGRRTDCPADFECCIGEKDYFDKTCQPEDYVCCGDHVCEKTEADCKVKGCQEEGDECGSDVLGLTDKGECCSGLKCDKGVLGLGQGICTKGLDIWSWVKGFLLALVTAVVFTGIGVVATFIIPQLAPFRRFLLTPIGLLLTVGILTIIIWMFAMGLAIFIAGSIIGV